MSATIINSIGLVLDSIGVMLLMFKVLPPLIKMVKLKDNGGTKYFWELEDEEDQQRMKGLYDKQKGYRKYFIVSLVLIIGGFALQILSNHI